ncbi:HD domain-containing protein [Alicyclobacillus tolerans]|uniref:HD-GYP domain-containing protein n=1 Tax=Alicyclobacillus tolerans TaxID=90970 RepID=UPI001F462930|nr:HD domain-containing phosphohydrolase [Alicyclobacillus tolerans]MCF8563992.1 HD domain-containing protein [Alicyclobacillus tolerans]
MIQLTISSDGLIKSATGSELLEVFSMTDEELVGLPYAVIDKEQLEMGIHTRIFVQRTGDTIPVQMAVFRKNGEWMVWAQPLLGDKQDELRLQASEVLFQSIAYVTSCGDPELKAHVQRVGKYARFCAERILRWNTLDAKRLELAALVHDVGKITIPSVLRLKPGELDHDERRYIEQHTERGHHVIVALEQRFAKNALWMMDQKLLHFAKDVTLFHHENWDGSGYPTNLSGTDIPMAARVVKMLDVIDALLSHRVYKSPWPWRKVKEQVILLSGTELDETLVKELVLHEPDFLRLVEVTHESIPSVEL